MWNFVSGDKAQLALSAGPKLQIQKCNTCRDIQNLSRRIRSLQWYSMAGVKENFFTFTFSIVEIGSLEKKFPKPKKSIMLSHNDIYEDLQTVTAVIIMLT